jgi:hypothetical protein
VRGGASARRHSALEDQLKKEKRIDTATATYNDRAARFYARRGYRSLGEWKAAMLL